jgi:hypothetical protein
MRVVVTFEIGETWKQDDEAILKTSEPFVYGDNLTQILN